MKIYTRGGDKGKSGLIGGNRVDKDDLRLEAYGAVDELVAAIGFVRSQDDNGEFHEMLAKIQSHLFVVGSHLAAPPGAGEGLPVLRDEPTGELELWIDTMEGELPPLGNFILPGGEPLGAALHLSRTICRRAERRVVTLVKTLEKSETVGPLIVVYLNRLSDFLFVAARLANRRVGADEERWHP